ncbi:hypothetical protein KAX29_06160 [candidate division WOR-3 bacterium]|nr:hypothetical protein [candidate division WOR-3 bacterium]
MSNRAKIVTLWIVFLFGMVFHSLLAMMPIFWGESVAMSPELIAKNPIAPMMWMSLFFYLIPMIVIAMVLFIEAKWNKVTNFVFTLVFTLMNIFHIAEHLGTSPVDSCQILLLTFVLISGILLNIVSYRWMKE